jgi:hypothetical protein
MKFPNSVVASLLLLAFFSSLASAEKSRLNATATQMSKITVKGFLYGVFKDSRSSDELKKCLSAIDDTILTDTFTELMSTRFSSNEIATLDEFYSTELGERYIAALGNSRGIASDAERQFQAAEIEAIQRITQSELGSRMQSIPRDKANFQLITEKLAVPFHQCKNDS